MSIPLITDPMGYYWTQPHTTEIAIDDTHALMSKAAFDRLYEYSHSQPTGVYVGKMWRRLQDGEWWLCWFGESEKGPNYCSNNYRKILIA